jgi:flagellar protein FlaG
MSGELQATQSFRATAPAAAADTASLAGSRDRGQVVTELQDHAIKLGSPGAVVPPPKVDTTNMRFSHDPESGRMLMQITDPASGEVIRQMPSEDMLKVARAVSMMQGALLKEKA